MQKAFNIAGSQAKLIEAITTWQEEQRDDDFSIFLETITFIPYFQGRSAAIVNYREAQSVGNSGIIIREVINENSASSEKAVFSAMAGGTDGG